MVDLREHLFPAALQGPQPMTCTWNLDKSGSEDCSCPILTVTSSHANLPATHSLQGLVGLG